MAIAVLPIAWVVSLTTRRIITSTARKRHWEILEQLAPAIASLLLLPGMRLFVELAPLADKPTRWLDDGTYVITVLLVLSLIRKAATLGIEWGSHRTMAQNALHKQGFIPLLRNVITLFVFFAGAIMVLKHFNYDVMSLLTALGVGSLAVGLAAKDTLSNMIAGFMLIIDRNLSPGDRVNLTGTVGDVEEIGLRSTRLRLGDGNLMIVPNSELVNTKILNLSLPARTLLCKTTFKMTYEPSFERVRAICLESLGSVDRVLKKPSPGVSLSSIAEAGQTVSVTFWVNDLNDGDPAVSEVNIAIMQRLAAAGILPKPIL